MWPFDVLGAKMPKQIRPTILEVAGPTDIRAISECHAKLLRALQRHKSIQIDLTQSTEPDLTLVQLIESARRYGVATGRTIALAQPVDGVLREILVRGGFLSAAQDREFWLHETRAN
jgi:hypothetical protein